MTTLSHLIDSYYRAWLRFYPEAAVDLGIDEYADRLRPYDDDDIGALISLHEELLDALDELDEQSLDKEQRIDVRLMRGSAALDLQELIETDWRRRNPLAFVPVHAIYQLTIRPVAQLQKALTARLTAIPGYLRGARAHLAVAPEQIPANWLEAAQIEAVAGANYLRGLQHHPQIGTMELNHLLDTAAHALEEFAQYLEQDLAQYATGDFACGLARYEALLHQRHFLDVDANTLHALGQRLYVTTWSELQALTRALSGQDDIAVLGAKIQAQHLPKRGLLAEYRLQMQAAKEFVTSRQLVSLPEKERLSVVETPAFLQHQIPIAAYLEPTPTEPMQHGYYYVTPSKQEAELGEHNTISIRHTCVHEAWPGHHLQFVTANLNPLARSLPRLLNPSATLYEGWALYTEQLLHEQGFLDAPESEFVLLKDRLWRALRIMLDVELHTRGLNLTEAAARMQDKLGFSHNQAMAELGWYSRAPGVPMGYATGWALILASRKFEQTREATFSLQGFHDRLLSAGSIALPLVLESRFSNKLWQHVRQEVFGPPCG